MIGMKIPGGKNEESRKEYCKENLSGKCPGSEARISS
jgi:hypothetical protein